MTAGRIARRLAIGLPLALVAVLAVLYLARNHLVKSAVENGSRQALGVEVALAGVDLDLRGTTFGMEDYRAHNPEGFDPGDFLRLERGALAVEGGSIFSSTIVVPRLQLEGLHLELLQTAEGSNFGTVLSHLEAFRGEGGPEPSREGKRLLIRELVIQGISVSARLELPGADPVQAQAEVKGLRMTDVGGEEGLTIGQVAGVVTQAVLDRALDEVGGRLPEALARGLRGRLGGMTGLDELGIHLEGASGSGSVDPGDLLDKVKGLVGGGSR